MNGIKANLKCTSCFLKAIRFGIAKIPFNFTWLFWERIADVSGDRVRAGTDLNEVRFELEQLLVVSIEVEHVVALSAIVTRVIGAVVAVHRHPPASTQLNLASVRLETYITCTCEYKWFVLGWSSLAGATLNLAFQRNENVQRVCVRIVCFDLRQSSANNHNKAVNKDRASSQLHQLSNLRSVKTIRCSQLPWCVNR